MIFCSYTMIVTIVLQQGAQMKRKPETKRLDPAAKEALQQFKCELSQELEHGSSFENQGTTCKRLTIHRLLYGAADDPVPEKQNRPLRKNYL